MAKPGRSGAYANQSSAEVGNAVSFALDDSNWTESPKSFEVNVLPPGFTIDAAGLNLGGVAGCKMLYILFVRGINAEGAGEWFPLQWIVSTAEVTGRTLYGLPIDWPATPQHALGAGAIVIRAVRPGQIAAGASGALYVNDIGIDGTSDIYTEDFRSSQILANGVGATFLRASVPGWEIIIDTNG